MLLILVLASILQAVRFESGTGGWEARTVPLCHVVPLVSVMLNLSFLDLHSQPASEAEQCCRGRKDGGHPEEPRDRDAQHQPEGLRPGSWPLRSEVWRFFFLLNPCALTLLCLKLHG